MPKKFAIAKRRRIMIRFKAPSKETNPGGKVTHGFGLRGKGRHPFYSSWASMKTRCYNESTEHYKYYGGKGVKVCKKWWDFKGFHEDMFSSWKRGLQLDRKDNTGNYEKSNCKWSTRLEQMSNTKRNHYIQHNGEKLTVTQWSRHLGGSRNLVERRIRVGMTEQEPVSFKCLPLGGHKKRV